MQLCPYCDGEGEDLDMARCTECDGSGVLDDEPKECYYCKGTGKDELDEMGYCKPCNGTGVVL